MQMNLSIYDHRFPIDLEIFCISFDEQIVLMFFEGKNILSLFEEPTTYKIICSMYIWRLLRSVNLKLS